MTIAGKLAARRKNGRRNGSDFDFGAPSASLMTAIAQESARPVSPQLQVLVERLRERFGNAMQAMLFYGSCLRDGVKPDALVDLYVIVDDYDNDACRKIGGIANHWLPPTVFQLRTQTTDGHDLHAKCALISLKDLEKGTRDWFQSYLWARFSQPSRLVYCRDESIRFRVHLALANAVLRMMSETIAIQDQPLSTNELWQRAFALTYGTELRPESANRPALIVSHDQPFYARVTDAAQHSILSLSRQPGQTENTWARADSPRTYATARWKLRRYQGRAVNVLRLIKSLFTFEDGVGYVIWKLERHLGEPVKVSPYLHRFPLIFCWPLLWRLLRQRRLR